MRNEKHSIEGSGAHVVLVGMGMPKQTEAFKNEFQVPFTMISDPHQDLYEAFGLKQMLPWEFLSPTLVLKGMSLLAKGQTMGMPQGDVRQLSGTFVITTDGRIAFRHIAKNASDHPSPRSLLKVLQTLD